MTFDGNVNVYAPENCGRVMVVSSLNLSAFFKSKSDQILDFCPNRDSKK